MAYQSLYRKYRPQTFADVVGQGHVTRTIQNSLISGRIGHGYLFTGTRGTAKTTVARLLAKALNCESSDKPVAEPCNRCAACVSITAGSAIDVIEMDAASHRGVADMEEVRKSVGYGPMELRYKVFIIDEAHQLSSDAKDAFLKTLEEPPANAVFILATTEPQSIPITIRSRCQQFDFKRGSLSDITERLRYVLTSEGVAFSNGALSDIARGAEGSYRDSLSLLEQVLAFSPDSISASDVNLVLGTLDTEMLQRVTRAIAGHDAASAFALAGELLDAGKEARTLLRTLSLHFRDLLLVSVGGPAVSQELTPEEIGPLQQEARSFKPQQLMRAMEIVNDAQGETRWNNQHRLLVELTFLKLMNLGESAATQTFAAAPIVFPATRPVADSRPQSPVVPRTIPQPVAKPPVTTRAVVQTPLAAMAPPLALTPPPATQFPAAETSAIPAGFFAGDTTDLEDDYEPDEPEDTLTPSLFGDPSEAPTVTEAGVSVAAPVLPDSRVETIHARMVDLNDPAFDTLKTKLNDLQAEVTTSGSPAGFPQLTVRDIERVWPIFLEKARSVSKMTETNMLQARPTSVEGGVVVITFRSRSPYEMMGEPKRLDFVRELLKRSLGIDRISVRFALDDDAGPAPTRSAGPKKGLVRDPLAELDSMSQDSGNGSRLDDIYEYGRQPPPDYRDAIPSLGDPPPYENTFAPRIQPPVDAAAPRNGYNQPAVSQTESPTAFPVVSGTDPGLTATEHSEALANNALVQEVLSTFGGVIVNE